MELQKSSVVEATNLKQKAFRAFLRLRKGEVMISPKFPGAALSEEKITAKLLEPISSSQPIAYLYSVTKKRSSSSSISSARMPRETSPGLKILWAWTIGTAAILVTSVVRTRLKDMEQIMNGEQEQQSTLSDPDLLDSDEGIIREVKS
ncbi:hypothetical protein SADUNF_Sadunf12G0105100 [Salix dunnii]|uniref:Uncharacterized protein n=1 Tax=Salix dunnii TaxID=1413687 RepID=A0A835JP32_9ROSI|nr:hypothetical protein SADUNF_Sadunf12G0105100 [Salix dunnii]